jgi:hypothetical protein
MKTINSRWFASVVPAVVGFGFTALCVRGFRFYGLSLFVGIPLVVCFLSAFCTSFRRDVSFRLVYWTSMVSLALLCGMILLFGLDGLICLIMAFPLAMILGVIAVLFGRALVSACRGGARAALPVVLVLAFPVLVGFDRSTRPPLPKRTVSTCVIIHSPIDRVWRTVIAFPRITAPIGGIFRFGIAYPIEARIEGVGVGAIRHCVFSTGSFVEPITAWQEPTLLAFDVSSSPPPMEELSFYEHLDAPHLHGYMISHRGQFQLKQAGDEVILEGTTSFTHSLSPDWYWGPISDHIIHKIHERVLNHIKHTAEGR